MWDYINYITPQFSRTDINFQRVPTVDTSNPFITREIPTADESFIVIRFKEHKSYDLLKIKEALQGSFLSRVNTLVVPGSKMQFAMEIILQSKIEELIS